jgi:hypothetical protein
MDFLIILTGILILLSIAIWFTIPDHSVVVKQNAEIIALLQDIREALKKS